MLSTFKTVLTKKTQLVPNVFLYHFNLLEPQEIVFVAGQYLMLKIPTEKGTVSRLYSIASPSSGKNNFDLIIQLIPGGLASNYLSNFKENDRIDFLGPAGIFGLKNNNRPIIFLVTGTGIAPIRSILFSNDQSSLRRALYLFWGLKTYKEIYLLQELREYELQNKNFKLKICLSREENLNQIPEDVRSLFDSGHVDSSFEKLIVNNEQLMAGSDFYLCGGRAVVDSLLLFLLGRGVLRENIYFEKY